MNGRASHGDRGVIAVELGLCLPVLLAILLGGLHLARAIHARHRLSDAVSVAARAAAISGSTDQGTIAALVVQRLAQGQNGPPCDGNPVITATQVGASPFSRLEVSATCNLPPPFGKTLLGSMGPTSVSSTASMPLP